MCHIETAQYFSTGNHWSLLRAAKSQSSLLRGSLYRHKSGNKFRNPPYIVLRDHTSVIRPYFRHHFPISSMDHRASWTHNLYILYEWGNGHWFKSPGSHACQEWLKVLRNSKYDPESEIPCPSALPRYASGMQVLTKWKSDGNKTLRRPSSKQYILYSYFMPVWWIVNTMPRGAVYSSVHYYPRP